MQLTVLVTGGSGLIGKKTVEKLLNEGYRVISLQRSDSTISGVETLQYDACKDDWNSIVSKLNDISAIVHLGGVIETGTNEFQKDLIRKVNIEYSKNLINFAVNKGISRFVFASTLSFTKLPLPSIIFENSELEPTTFYAESKKHIEDHLTQCSVNSTLGFNILRISSPISESIGELHNTVIKKWVEKARSGEILQVYGRGLRSQDFVNTEDVAEAISLCLKNSIDGIFNIASGNSVSMIDLVERISSKFGVEYEFVKGEEIDELNWQVNIDKAKLELGFAPKYTSGENVNRLLNKL